MTYYCFAGQYLLKTFFLEKLVFSYKEIGLYL